MTHPFAKITPEVSVVMSCYNAERWLGAAIDSVLVQSFENFEFILIDDGSIDRTWEIIRSYESIDERIVAISKENTGLADSLNVGIAQARGAWIARLDADDLCEPTRLLEQVAFMRSHPEVVLLGSGFTEIDEHCRPIKRHFYPRDHEILVKQLERSQRSFPHSSTFYRTDVVRQIGGYNGRIHRAEDVRLWLEFALRGRIACLSTPLVRIRRHPNQISLDANGRRQLYDGGAARACHFLLKAGCKDPSVDADLDHWMEFLNWVECRIEESGTFDRRQAWSSARSEYFSSRDRAIGILRFCRSIVQSGHAISLVWEKIFGSSMPQRLAQEWREKSNVR